MFGRRAKYALQACIRLAGHNDDTPIRIEEICEPEQLPRKFLESILLDLKRAGLLVSRKGPGGGYQLARDPKTITVAEILKAVEGPPIPYRCVVIRSDKTCEGCMTADLCAIGPLMRDARDGIIEILSARSLADLGAETRNLERTQNRRAQAGAHAKGESSTQSK